MAFAIFVSILIAIQIPIPRFQCWGLQMARKDVLIIFILQETKNSIWFDKSCTQENVKCHVHHAESRLRWIIIDQVNYRQHYFLLIFPERNCARTVSNALRKKQLWCILKKWRQNKWRRICERVSSVTSL